MSVNGLQPIQHIQITFEPRRLLWIPSVSSLLVADNDGNRRKMCAIRVGSHLQMNEMAQYNRYHDMALDGSCTVRVYSWCLVNASEADENVVLFDGNSGNLVRFKIMIT